MSVRLPLPRLAEHWAWQLRAECRGVPAEVFFTAESDKGHRRDAHEETAKKICRGCPVLQHCRDYAVAADEPYGIWGATTPQERKELRDQHRLVAREAG